MSSTRPTTTGRPRCRRTARSRASRRRAPAGSSRGSPSAAPRPPSSSPTTPVPPAKSSPAPSSRPGVDRRRLAELVAAAGEVAQDQREPGDQPAGEPAAGLVVPGEQQVHREDQDRVEQEPGDHLEHDRPPLRGQRRAARPATGRAARGRRRPAPRPARPGRAGRRAPVRRRRKTRLATPVAATTSTEISPRVSQARMSTRVTLTMFLPPPKS